MMVLRRRGGVPNMVVLWIRGEEQVRKPEEGSHWGMSPWAFVLPCNFLCCFPVAMI